MKRLTFAALATAVIAIGCRDQRLLQPPSHGGPAAMIVDGAHNGNPDFFFLPPLVPDPSTDPNFDPGKFNPKLAPTVEVCVLTGDPGVITTPPAPPVACDPSASLVFGPAPMALDLTNEQYRVNWDTKSPAPLDASKFFRITVRGAARGTPLGSLDIDPVDQGVKNLKTGDVVVFQDGRTLPIKVRIEQNAFGSTNRDHVEQVVPNHITTPFFDVTTNTGFAGARFFDGWLPLGFDQVVVIIERIPVNDATASTNCLRSGDSELEGCYRFRTDPDLHGLGPDGTDLTFRVNVIAGVCFEIPGAAGSPGAPPYGLNRREEVAGVSVGPIVTLEDVPAPFLTCGTFARTPPPSVLGVIKSGQLRELPSAAWHALVRGVTRLVAPRALNAVDLGAGGSTNGFSRFGWLRSATMTKVITTDNQVGAPSTALPVDPKVCLTYSHHAVSQPLASEPVTFTVVTGGGTVGGGSSATVSTGTDGCAHASWVLGATPGVNTLRATALADGSPQTFTATGIMISSLDAGERQSCSVASNGTAYCWGSNAFGQLGNGGTSDANVPTPVSTGVGVATISSTFHHSCALGSNGRASCWGRNLSGALGDGTTTDRSTPVPVSGGLTFISISTGGIHACGLTADGAAYCWGDNVFGQLGSSTVETCPDQVGGAVRSCSTTPAAVSGGLSFRTISAGFFHTCGLRGDGAAFCWGRGTLGNLGTGARTSATAPVPVTGGLTFEALTAGAEYTCGLATGGAAYCWGVNLGGQLGLGPTNLSGVVVPTAVSGDLRFVSLSAANENNIFGHTCGIIVTGPAYCWGASFTGEIGAPTTETCPGLGVDAPHPCATSPLPVSGGLSFRAITAGIDHTCGIATSGGAYCWGGNASGQLGNGTTTASSTPVLVSRAVSATP